MKPLIRLMILAVAAMTAAATAVVAGASPAAADDFGPDTCLQGYVWRDATDGDHVCVRPSTRSQAHDDNDEADDRRDPDGGPFGPDTCQQGYVWREATDDDHVCVTPSTRSQTHSDNAEAANRRATLSLWISRWYPPSDCDDDCSTSDNDVPRIQVNGDHFNVGRVWIGTYRRSNGHLIDGFWVSATARSGFVAGRFRHHTDELYCDSGSETRYIRAYDRISHRWSSKLGIRTGCVHP